MTVSADAGSGDMIVVEFLKDPGCVGEDLLFLFQVREGIDAAVGHAQELVPSGLIKHQVREQRAGADPPLRRDDLAH